MLEEYISNLEKRVNKLKPSIRYLNELCNNYFNLKRIKPVESSLSFNEYLKNREMVLKDIIRTYLEIMDEMVKKPRKLINISLEKPKELNIFYAQSPFKIKKKTTKDIYNEYLEECEERKKSVAHLNERLMSVIERDLSHTKNLIFKVALPLLRDTVEYTLELGESRLKDKIVEVADMNLADRYSNIVKTLEEAYSVLRVYVSILESDSRKKI